MNFTRRCARHRQALALLCCLAIASGVAGCARDASEPVLESTSTSAVPALEVQSTSTLPSVATTTPIVIPLTPIQPPTPTSTIAPPTPTEAIVAPTREPTTHTVQSGETVAQIAQAYGTSVDAIVEANDLEDPNFIWVGQKLIIP